VNAYYFGCWQQSGHFLRTPDGDGGCHWRHADSLLRDGVVPWGYKIDGTLTPKTTTKQGAAALHHLDGWTALACHDYTVDSRGNSNSAFVFDAVLDFDQALTAAREHFPKVVERVGPIVLVESP